MMKNVAIAVLAAAVVWMGVILVRREPVVESGLVLPAPMPPGPLAAVLEEMLAAPEFSAAAIGFCLIDDAGKLVLGLAEGTAMIPASTLKSVTTATALEVIGPDYRFETTLKAQHPVAADGTLEGDLVIVGSGDPMLDESVIVEWVAGLQAKGLKRISGGVVGDAGCFPEPLVGDFWDWSDVGNGYGSPVAGLNLNHNRYVGRLRPGSAPGDAAVFLGAVPDVPAVEWDVAVTTAAAGSGDGVMIYGGPGATTIRIRGTVPAGGDVFEVKGAVPDPARFAAYHLDRLLREVGIGIAIQPSGARKVPVGAATLATHASVPLIEIVRSLHAVSDNHEAECLFRLLQVQTGVAPEEVIRTHWLGRGLDLKDCRIVDGSGLGRANTITPRDLAMLLYLARHGAHGDAFHESLNSYHDGAVRLKAGAMSGIRGYAGYVTASSGREFTFALLLNHFRDASAIQAWLDRLLITVIAS